MSQESIDQITALLAQLGNDIKDVKTDIADVKTSLSKQVEVTATEEVATAKEAVEDSTALGTRMGGVLNPSHRLFLFPICIIELRTSTIGLASEHQS